MICIKCAGNHKREFVGSRALESYFYICSDGKKRRLDEDGESRIEYGDWEAIEEAGEKSLIYRTRFHVFAVQPGLSRKEASIAQLDLLSVTESYLKETYLIPFTIIASE